MRGFDGVKRMLGFHMKPLMSFSQPSHVPQPPAATTSHRRAPPCDARRSIGMTASRTTPTLCVFVIITGPPETGFFPPRLCRSFRHCHSATTSPQTPRRQTNLFARGRIEVTPVRTGPLPTSSFPSPEISVVCADGYARTSVMALNGPGVPSKGTPRSRARGLAAFFSCGKEGIAIRTEANSKAKERQLTAHERHS